MLNARDVGGRNSSVLEKSLHTSPDINKYFPLQNFCSFHTCLSFYCVLHFKPMTTFIFPSSSNIPQNTAPQRVVTDADIDPVLLALQLPAPSAPIRAPEASLPTGQDIDAIHSSLSTQQHGTQSVSQRSITPLAASNEEERSSPPPDAPRMNSATATNHSWAARNPTRPIIEPRPRGGKLTNAQKASRAIAREQKQVSMKKLDDDIKAFAQDQTNKITELATKHNTSVERIKGQLGVHTHYKKSRKPALHNALLHAQAECVNQGGV